MAAKRKDQNKAQKKTRQQVTAKVLPAKAGGALRESDLEAVAGGTAKDLTADPLPLPLQDPLPLTLEKGS